MANKGTTLTIESKYKIAVSKTKDRREIVKKIGEYIQMLLDPNEKGLIPSIVSASLFAGISKKALLTWELSTAEESEVRVLLDTIRDMEEQYLRNNGLRGVIDSKLTTILLKAEHGVKEQPTQLTQNNTFNVSPELLAEAIQLSRTNKKDKDIVESK